MSTDSYSLWDGPTAQLSANELLYYSIRNLVNGQKEHCHGMNDLCLYRRSYEPS
jgi:hypothetical protein